MRRLSSLAPLGDASFDPGQDLENLDWMNIAHLHGLGPAQQVGEQSGPRREIEVDDEGYDADSSNNTSSSSGALAIPSSFGEFSDSEAGPGERQGHGEAQNLAQPSPSDEQIRVDLTRNLSNMPQSVRDFLFPPSSPGDPTATAQVQYCTPSHLRQVFYLATKAMYNLNCARAGQHGAIDALRITLDMWDSLLTSPGVPLAARIMEGLVLLGRETEVRGRLRLYEDHYYEMEEALNEAVAVIQEIRRRARLLGVELPQDDKI